MKLNDQNISEHDLDLHIFEYLEGNLSPDLASELESQATFDDSLEEELNCWKATVFEQDFHNTELLEKKLYEIPSIHNKNVTSSTYFPTLAILTLMLSFVPLSFERYNNGTVEHIVHLESNDTGKSDKNPDLPNLSNFEPKINVSKEGNKTAKRGLTVQPYEDRWEFEEITPLEPLKEAESIYTASMNTKIAFVDEPAEKSISILKRKGPKRDGKTRRSIERFKEKALQERRAMEFMKGNRPYVVPLNSNF